MFVSLNRDRRGSVFVERPTRVREVAGLIPSRVIQNTINFVVMAPFRVAGLVLRLTVRINGPVLQVAYPGNAAIELKNC